MNGITILNTIVNPITAFQWTGSAVIVLLTVIVITLIILWMAWQSGVLPEISPLFVLLWFFGAVFIFAAGDTQVDSYLTYEVTVSEEVSLAEFNEQYEIIKQRGQIFEVKERIE